MYTYTSIHVCKFFYHRKTCITTMPFRSKAQLRTCFSGNMKGVNCREWLGKTKESICCLPEKVGEYPAKCRQQYKGERIIGKVQTGPRGGRFFVIEEKSKNGKPCKIKVYVKG